MFSPHFLFQQKTIYNTAEILCTDAYITPLRTLTKYRPFFLQIFAEKNNVGQHFLSDLHMILVTLAYGGS
jgi:hypothetical protein